MNLTGLTRSIQARIIGDTGPDGLFNTTDGLLYDSTRAGPWRFRRNMTSDIESTVLEGFPVVVWRLERVAKASPGFEFDDLVATVAFDVYGRPPQRPEDTGDIDLATITDRIFGDSSAQVGGVPTFGLHNFTPGDTNWGGWRTSGPFRHIETTTGYDEKMIVFSTSFSINYGRIRPSI